MVSAPCSTRVLPWIVCTALAVVVYLPTSYQYTGAAIGCGLLYIIAYSVSALRPYCVRNSTVLCVGVSHAVVFDLIFHIGWERSSVMWECSQHSSELLMAVAQVTLTGMKGHDILPFLFFCVSICVSPFCAT